MVKQTAKKPKLEMNDIEKKNLEKKKKNPLKLITKKITVIHW